MKRENPFVSLLINVILPVMVLQQLGKRLGEQGPLIALILALALPLGYGIWDYLRNKHKNYISLFGLVSVAFTGGFALLRLEGFWFAVKEAAFPALMAFGVAASAHSKKPLMGALFYNDHLLRLPLIEQRLHENNQQSSFQRLNKKSTLWLSLSFILSSVLNYVLARMIFTELDPGLAADVRTDLLNGQIAKMTGMGFVAIALPMMIFTGAVLYYYLKSLGRLTQLSFEEMVKG